MPNNPVGIVDAEGRNNYLAADTPYDWDYKAFSNRVDWNISPRHRMFVRWSYNDFFEDRGDWTFETMRGLHSNNLVRTNIGATRGLQAARHRAALGSPPRRLSSVPSVVT
jgi:hypothetical protein